MAFRSAGRGQPDWCPRCGQPADIESELPCRTCWEGRPDAEVFALIVAIASEAGERRGAWEAVVKRQTVSPGALSAEERSTGRRASQAQEALDRLAGIADPCLAAMLVTLIRSHDDPGVRAACATSLGWIADPIHNSALELLLQDASPIVRIEALRSLAEAGGADVLARHLAATPDEAERAEAALGLAWLGDRRSMDVIRDAARSELLAGGPAHSRTATWAFIRLADEDELLWLAHELSDQAAPTGVHGVRRAADALVATVFWDKPAALKAVTQALDGVATQLPVPTAEDPAPPRSSGVPCRATVALHEHPPEDRAAWPHTKFGGQPDWRQPPAWPVAEDGHPLVFVAQFDLGGPEGPTAYVFLDETSGMSFEPLGSGNAVVIQPGPLPEHVTCEPEATGPRVYERVQTAGFRIARPFARPYERWAEETDGLDPESWDDDEFGETPPVAKVGGTPRWVQDDEAPPGDTWRFACQFDGARTGRDADQFEYYGFIDDDGRGALLGQCG